MKKKNKIEYEDIRNLMKNATVKIETVFDKCTVVTMKLENGFTLVESSGCVDVKNYDESIGIKICLKAIEERLWELEGYSLSKKLYEENKLL